MFSPGSLEDALRVTKLELDHEEGEWVVVVAGFPREWHNSREGAENKASEWNGLATAREVSVEHVPGGTWLVMAGDQFVFSSPSRDEAAGFVFGVIVGNAWAYERSAPRWLPDPTERT